MCVDKRYKRGDFFGELALTGSKAVRSASVSAGWSGARVFKLSREAFEMMVLDGQDVLGVLETEKQDYTSYNRLLSAVPILKHLDDTGLTALAVGAMQGNSHCHIVDLKPDRPEISILKRAERKAYQSKQGGGPQ